MSAESTITLVLADDHSIVRSGLRMLLEFEPGLEVVAEASDVDETLRVVGEHGPDVLVFDLNMPGSLTSLDALWRMGDVSPETRTVILTMQNDPAYAREALSRGALGYVLKDAADAELIEAIRRAASGQTYLNPSLGSALATPPDESGPR